MSEKGTGKPAGKGAVADKPQESKAAPKFLVGKLREECIALFGVTSSTFDGAFYGCEDAEMSIEDAKARIESWLGKEIE